MGLSSKGRVAVAGAAIAALLAACGSSGQQNEDFIAQGDEICALGTFQIGAEAQNRYGQPQAPPRKSREFAREVVAPILRAQVLDKLRALNAPPDDVEELNALFAALERGIERLRANPGLLTEPNAGGVFDEANRRAQAYGFNQCGQG